MYSYMRACVLERMLRRICTKCMHVRVQCSSRQIDRCRHGYVCSRVCIFVCIFVCMYCACMGVLRAFIIVLVVSS
jgi:hypothetical protein